MAYGVEDPVKQYRKKKKDEVKKPNPKDRFDELEKEINERENFLADMTRIGQGCFIFFCCFNTELFLKAKSMMQLFGAKFRS